MMKGRSIIEQQSKLFWLPLDNAAKIFPAIRTKENTTVLRLTVILKERVALKYLIKSVSLAEKRFPYYKVSLHRGIFWYYLQESIHPFKILPDTGHPCSAFVTTLEHDHLVRVLVFKNRLSVEFSHILTDGYGASQFLIWILEKYYALKDKAQRLDLINIPNDEIIKEEAEDAYSRFFKEDIPYKSKQKEAYHLPFRINKKASFDVLVAILNLSEIKILAAANRVSITEYLVAVYLFVLQQIEGEDKWHKRRIIRIQVPVNLRNIYPSKTMRNFSLFVMPEIDTRLGHYSFEEIVKIVYHKMRLETDEKLISKIISRNVGSEKKNIIRGIPILLKNFVLRYKYYAQGSNLYSGVITNLGNINLPESIDHKIDYFVVTPPPPNRKLKINCGVIGFNNKLVLSFGNITCSKELERSMITFLTNQGIKVSIKKLMEL